MLLLPVTRSASIRRQDRRNRPGRSLREAGRILAAITRESRVLTLDQDADVLVDIEIGQDTPQ